MNGTQLILRCINTARSAFVSISFRNEYFDHFDVFHTTTLQACVHIKARITSRQLLQGLRAVGLNCITLGLCSYDLLHDGACVHIKALITSRI